MPHRWIKPPQYKQTETPSSSSHPGAAGGPSSTIGRPSSAIANFVDRVKFEAKKIKKGGRRKIFLEKFTPTEVERLLDSSHCSLSATGFYSTEAGDVAGLLFISTEKIAFCSQRSITFDFNLQNNETVEQFEIPLRNIRRDTDFGDPHQKIIRIRTDNSELLFKGFLRYGKALQNLETAMPQHNG